MSTPAAPAVEATAEAAPDGGGRRRRTIKKPLSKKRLEEHLAAAENRGAPSAALLRVPPRPWRARARMPTPDSQLGRRALVAGVLEVQFWGIANLH